MFIRVERTSKWDEHLETLRKMLNLFGPTGRINYAKSSRLYLQSMQNIQSNHQWPLDQCCKSSFHCLPRTNRFWVGLLPDLVIEQCMVWALKKKKWLDRRSVMAKSTRDLWVGIIHECASGHAAMLEIARVLEVKEVLTDKRHIWSQWCDSTTSSIQPLWLPRSKVSMHFHRSSCSW